MSVLLTAARGLTRAWVGLYTRGLDTEAREERRTEIESDLWEHQAWARGTGEGPADTGSTFSPDSRSGFPPTWPGAVRANWGEPRCRRVSRRD